jgi:hypothetical protein
LSITRKSEVRRIKDVGRKKEELRRLEELGQATNLDKSPLTN